MLANLTTFLRPSVARACAATLALGVMAAPAQSVAATPSVIHISPDQQVALGVRLAQVEPAKEISITLPARVVVPVTHQAVVAAPVSGLLTRILVNTGDTVTRGERMAEMRSPEIALLQRQRRDAVTQQQLARAQVQRDAQLVHEGIIPGARLQQAQARQREADAMVAERDVALRLAAAEPGLNGRAQVLASMAGVVTQALALPGQRVEMAAPLFRIAAPGQLGLEIEATPAQAAPMQPGATVEVPEAHASGILKAKAPALSAGQTVILRVEMTRPGTLHSGALVQARLDVPAARGTWRVPPAAVTQLGGRDVVLVFVPGGFQPQPVQIEARLDDAVLVAGPLKTGDRVAASSVVAIKAAAGAVTP